MINIINKEKCCGCGACEQICPQKCIILKEDNEGFLYPIVNEENCIKCDLCEKVCPVLLDRQSKIQLSSTYAAINPIEKERTESSSGGLFIAFAKYVIKLNGVVFGARFDADFNVIHDYTEEESELYLFMKSKYVQSKIGTCYIKVSQFLKLGKLVLFIGTPCQIAGLHTFLRKNYDNLITVDIVCHGVPSPGVWRKYIDEQKVIKENQIGYKITDIQFREKKMTGWKKYSFIFKYDNEFIERQYFKDSLWGKCFVSNLFLRPSCHTCSFKSLSSGSDITISDFWGIKNVYPLLDDDKGVSALIVNTNKGHDFIEDINLIKYECTIDDIVMDNKALVKSWSPNRKRSRFFLDYSTKKSVVNLLKSYSTNILKDRLKDIVRKIHLIPLIKRIKNNLVLLVLTIDQFLAILLTYFIKRDSNANTVMLIPADSLTGGFGEDVMVSGFIEKVDANILIITKRIKMHGYLKRKNIKNKRGLVGYFPCLSIINTMRGCNILYVIGADIMDGVYTNNKIRFALLKMANNLKIAANITGFSVREKSSKYFQKEINDISKYIKIKARDVDSFERLKQYVNPKDLILTSDIAFLCGMSNMPVDNDFMEWYNIEREKGKIVVAYCPNTIQAGEIGLNSYIRSQITLLNEFKKYNCSFIFLYHDLRRYVLNINDKQLSYMISKYFKNGNGYFVDNINDGVEVKSYIKYSDFTVSGRMHFGISGYTLLKPMFGVCYYNKFEGLQKMFEISPRYSLIEYTNVENGLDKVKQFVDNILDKTNLNKNLSKVKDLAELNY